MVTSKYPSNRQNTFKTVYNQFKNTVGLYKELQLKAECLVHFTYESTNQKLMLLDIQGSGYQLYDPEIATT